MRWHLAQFGVVDEVRSVSVDEGTESQAILPTKTQTTSKERTTREKEQEKKFGNG